MALVIAVVATIAVVLLAVRRLRRIRPYAPSRAISHRGAAPFSSFSLPPRTMRSRSSRTTDTVLVPAAVRTPRQWRRRGEGKLSSSSAAAFGVVTREWWDLPNGTPVPDRLWAPYAPIARAQRTLEDLWWAPPTSTVHGSASGEWVASCDPWALQVPFPTAVWMGCRDVLVDVGRWINVTVMKPKFEQRTIKFNVRVNVSGKARLVDRHDQPPRPQRQRQREGPFAAEAMETGLSAIVTPQQYYVEAIVKVPQTMFPIDPFSEVVAAHMDHDVLDIRRVPPTGLVAVPLEWLRAAIARDGPSIKMVDEFNRGGLSFVQWAEQDFLDFVTSPTRRDRFMVNHTHVWVSVQLKLFGVVPLLDSPLKVPYSKAKPGWHRWFNPEWPERDKVITTPLQRRMLLAISQLSMFDFIMLNADRSPNKNNFILEGCWREDPEATDPQWRRDRLFPRKRGNNHHVVGPTHCATSRNGGGKAEDTDDDSGGRIDVDGDSHQPPPSQLPASRRRGDFHVAAAFVHLDQGMSLYGFPQAHNPIAKLHNNHFCMFYGPLVDRVKWLVSAAAKDQLMEAATTENGAAQSAERESDAAAAAEVDSTATTPPGDALVVARLLRWFVREVLPQGLGTHPVLTQESGGNKLRKVMRQLPPLLYKVEGCLRQERERRRLAMTTMATEVASPSWTDVLLYP